MSIVQGDSVIIVVFGWLILPFSFREKWRENNCSLIMKIC